MTLSDRQIPSPCEFDKIDKGICVHAHLMLMWGRPECAVAELPVRPYCGGLAMDRTGEGAGLPCEMPAHEVAIFMPLALSTTTVESHSVQDQLLGKTDPGPVGGQDPVKLSTHAYL